MMLRTIIVYGLIAGGVVGVEMLVLAAVGGHISGPLGMAIGYLTMLLALSAVFVAIKRYRDQVLGGVIGFWRALGIGLAISLVAGICYVAAWEAVTAIFHLDFANAYAKAEIARKVAAGVNGAALARFTAEMDAFRTQYANPLYRLPMTFIEIFPVGVLVSLISAALLRNRRFLPAR